MWCDDMPQEPNKGAYPTHFSQEKKTINLYVHDTYTIPTLLGTSCGLDMYVPTAGTASNKS